MKNFHTVAVPHKDISEGKLTLDLFAADLWEVYQNRSSPEYKDKDIFFDKTYLTSGIKNVLDVVEKRLKGKGGDPVIQLQTPFGGGKTHTLIALYHKSKEWDAKSVVIVGTVLSKNDSLWGILELQLTGEIKKFKDNSAPGRETIRNLLEKHQPVLILIDELLEYMIKAATVKVGDSNLADQTIAFIQELTEVAKTLDKVTVVFSLPTGSLERFGELGEKMFHQIKKVSGRVEKIYEPVHENEVSKVIRQRLFSSINDEEAYNTIKETITYFEKENILPEGSELTEYRDRFVNSFPFLPEVIDILYHKWGSYPEFQRTRGVLKLLSLVIFSVKNKNIPYISLADFNLEESGIRRELLNIAGDQFDSVISADITGKNCGTKKVDNSLGDTFKGLSLGLRISQTVFMCSFSGGKEKGISLKDIKRMATTLENPANVITEALEQMKSKLFYLQLYGDKYFFDTQPNLNHVILTKMENIKDHDVLDFERELLRKSIGQKIRAYLWPEKDSDINDNPELKLIVLKERNDVLIKSIIENKGMMPRVYRNTIFFVYPHEITRISFIENVKKLISYRVIQNDSTITLSKNQKELIRRELEKLEDAVVEILKDMYRIVLIPSKDGGISEDLGKPFLVGNNPIDEIIYERLKEEDFIVEKISSEVLKSKYLRNNEYAITENIYSSFLKTLGELRISNKEVLLEAIKTGVLIGNFGLGILVDNMPVCKYFENNPLITLESNEIIIASSISREQLQKEQITGDKKEDSKPETGENEKEETELFKVPIKKTLEINFFMPPGSAPHISQMLKLLRNKFNKVEITIKTSEGEITEEDYENKIIETLKSIGTMKELLK